MSMRMERTGRALGSRRQAVRRNHGSSESQQPARLACPWHLMARQQSIPQAALPPPALHSSSALVCSGVVTGQGSPGPGHSEWPCIPGLSRGLAWRSWS